MIQTKKYESLILDDLPHNLYYCTKPFQFLSILNIVQNKIEKNSIEHLFICKKFSIDGLFQEKITTHYGKYFDSITFVDEGFQIFDYIDYKVDTLFTHSDVGEEGVFIRKVSPVYCYIYEEGSATYIKTFCNTFYSKLNAFLRKKSCYIGGLNCVTGVIVYYPEAYINFHGERKKIVKFPTNFMSNLNKNSDQFYDIFDFNSLKISNKSCCLIILGESGMDGLNQIDYKKYDEIFIKNHPHFLSKEKLSFFGDVIDSQIPVEFIILDLYKQGVLVDLYHFTSSAVIYVNDMVYNETDLSIESNFKIQYKKILRSVNQ
jgi:hypothetical protein